MSVVHLYLTVMYHQNEIWVLCEKHDKNDTTIACVPKLQFLGKIAFSCILGTKLTWCKFLSCFKCAFGA